MTAGGACEPREHALRDAVRVLAPVLATTAFPAGSPRAQEDGAAGYAAVKTVDHTGRIEFAILPVSRPALPPEVTELRERLDAAYKEALAAWNEVRAAGASDTPRTSRPRTKELKPVVQTQEGAEALIQREKNADLDRENPGRAARRRILNERFLDHFVLGVDAPMEWIIETRRRNGAMWDCQGQYLSGSAKPGETDDGQWFFKYGALEGMLRRGRHGRVVLFFTWYALAAFLRRLHVRAVACTQTGALDVRDSSRRRAEAPAPERLLDEASLMR
jgi:hypothetical protein